MPRTLKHPRPTPSVRALLLASALSCLVGCASYEEPSSLAEGRGEVVSAKLRPYVDEFIRLFGFPLTEMPISLGFLAKGKAGVCVRPPTDDSMLDTMVDGVLGDRATGERHIVISIDYFKRYKNDPGRLQQVVFHEMGHCYLERPHDASMMPVVNADGTFASGSVPDSIMHPVAFDSAIYNRHYKHYVDELFGRVGAAPAPASAGTEGGLATGPAGDGFGDCVVTGTADSAG
jgi:hypothetical protein